MSFDRSWRGGGFETRKRNIKATTDENKESTRRHVWASVRLEQEQEKCRESDNKTIDDHEERPKKD